MAPAACGVVPPQRARRKSNSKSGRYMHRTYQWGQRAELVQPLCLLGAPLADLRPCRPDRVSTRGRVVEAVSRARPPDLVELLECDDEITLFRVPLPEDHTISTAAARVTPHPNACVEQLLENTLHLLSSSHACDSDNGGAPVQRTARRWRRNARTHAHRAGRSVPASCSRPAGPVGGYAPPPVPCAELGTNSGRPPRAQAVPPPAARAASRPRRAVQECALRGRRLTDTRRASPCPTCVVPREVHRRSLVVLLVGLLQSERAPEGQCEGQKGTDSRAWEHTCLQPCTQRVLAREERVVRECDRVQLDIDSVGNE